MNPSLPLRKCGLKSSALIVSPSPQEVTSLAEVWIEITNAFVSSVYFRSLPLRKCGLKSVPPCRSGEGLGHFPCGSVDWNAAGGDTAKAAFSHFPCGSVDWNIYIIGKEGKEMSHFPCGSVDWNREILCRYSFCDSVTSLAEVWIEIFLSTSSRILSMVTSLAEVWIEIKFSEIMEH